MTAPRAARGKGAIRCAWGAVLATGVSAPLALHHHFALAVLAAEIAAVLALIALIWALKQEDRR